MSTLYIVATPIGNLEDISLRALRTLKEVDFIICEDTRVTSKLLARYEIQKPLVSYFQHSRFSKIADIIERLGHEENAALLTDAGTPGISDPGGVLVKHIITSGHPDIKIVPIPGSSAVITALSISGFPADSFLFLGFPPRKKGRQTFLKRVAEATDTVVFYESPHRIATALSELKIILKNTAPPGVNRKIMVCRELTKMFETVYRGTIDEVINSVQSDPIKGEYVVVVNSK